MTSSHRKRSLAEMCVCVRYCVGLPPPCADRRCKQGVRKLSEITKLSINKNSVQSAFLCPFLRDRTQALADTAVSLESLFSAHICIYPFLSLPFCRSLSPFHFISRTFYLAPFDQCFAQRTRFSPLRISSCLEPRSRTRERRHSELTADDFKALLTKLVSQHHPQHQGGDQP